MTFDQYIEQTEHAVKQLFEALAFYQALLKQVTPVIFVCDDTDAESLEKWCDQNREAIKIYGTKQREYIGYTVAQSTICGSILQISSMGIQWFSKNELIPSQYQKIIKEGSSPVKYCIGRLIRNIPIGLIIYAGRNQYNHMNEVKYRPITKKVFDQLACFEYSVKDPALDLENPKIIAYAHNILALFDWRQYGDYLKDIKNIIQ